MENVVALHKTAILISNDNAGRSRKMQINERYRIELICFRICFAVMFSLF